MYKETFGREIHPGDLITYPSASTRYSNLGIVTSIIPPASFAYAVSLSDNWKLGTIVVKCLTFHKPSKTELETESITKTCYTRKQTLHSNTVTKLDFNDLLAAPHISASDKIMLTNIIDKLKTNG